MTSGDASRAGALRLLGLARRAGSAAVGTRAAREAVRTGRAHLVVTADDASTVQLKKVLKLPGMRGVPRAVLGSRAALGAALGSGSVSALAVTDEEIARHVLQRLTASDSEEEEPDAKEGRSG